MADEMNISHSGYSRIERGDVNLTTDNLQKISEILEISPATILEFDQDKMVFNQNNNHFDNFYGYIAELNAPEKIFEMYKAQLEAKDEIITLLKQQLGVSQNQL